MLVRLMTEQIQANWALIKHVLEQTLPPIYLGQPEFYTACLDAMLEGQMQVWSGLNEGNPIGLVITNFVREELLDQTNMLIFAFHGFENMPLDVIRQGYETIAQSARAAGCSGLIAYTQDERVKQLAQRMGGKTQTFIRLEV